MFKKKFTLFCSAAFAFNSISAQVIVAGGGVNNYTIANYPGNFTNYYDGFSVIFRSNNNCTGPCTMQIGVAAQQPIVNTAGVALVAGDIRINQVVTIVYDQSAGNFQMVTASGNAGGGSSPWADGGTTIYPTNSGDFVGIGIVPTEKFEVAGTAKIVSASDPLIVRATSDGYGVRIREADDGNDAIGLYGYSSRGRIFLKNNGTNTVDIDASGTSYFNGGNVGIGTPSPLLKLDARGASDKLTTAYENIFQVASTDAAGPLALRMGIQTHATPANMYGSIEVDEAGIKRNLALQPNGGNLSVGDVSGIVGTSFDVYGTRSEFHNPSGGMDVYVTGTVFNGNRLMVAGQGGFRTTAPVTTLDARGMNTKDTPGFEDIFQIGSQDAVTPLLLRMGLQTALAGTGRWATIEVDDAGTKRDLGIQPAGGNVGIGTNQPFTTVDINGDLATRSYSFGVIGGIVSSSTPGFPAKSSFIELTGSAAFTLAGLPNPQPGKIVTVYWTNPGVGNNMTIANEDAINEFFPANRIRTQTGANVPTTNEGSATFIYSQVMMRWICISLRN